MVSKNLEPIKPSRTKWHVFATKEAIEENLSKDSIKALIKDYLKYKKGTNLATVNHQPIAMIQQATGKYSGDSFYVYGDNLNLVKPLYVEDYSHDNIDFTKNGLGQNPTLFTEYPKEVMKEVNRYYTHSKLRSALEYNRAPYLTNITGKFDKRRKDPTTGIRGNDYNIRPSYEQSTVFDSRQVLLNKAGIMDYIKSTDLEPATFPAFDFSNARCRVSEYKDIWRDLQPLLSLIVTYIAYDLGFKTYRDMRYFVDGAYDINKGFPADSPASNYFAGNSVISLMNTQRMLNEHIYDTYGKFFDEEYMTKRIKEILTHLDEYREDLLDVIPIKLTIRAPHPLDMTERVKTVSKLVKSGHQLGYQFSKAILEPRGKSHINIPYGVLRGHNMQLVKNSVFDIFHYNKVFGLGKDVLWLDYEYNQFLKDHLNTKGSLLGDAVSSNSEFMSDLIKRVSDPDNQKNDYMENLFKSDLFADPTSDCYLEFNCDFEEADIKEFIFTSLTKLEIKKDSVQDIINTIDIRVLYFDRMIDAVKRVLEKKPSALKDIKFQSDLELVNTTFVTPTIEVNDTRIKPVHVYAHEELHKPTLTANEKNDRFFKYEVPVLAYKKTSDTELKCNASVYDIVYSAFVTQEHGEKDYSGPEFYNKILHHMKTINQEKDASHDSRDLDSGNLYAIIAKSIWVPYRTLVVRSLRNEVSSLAAYSLTDDLKDRDEYKKVKGWQLGGMYFSHTLPVISNLVVNSLDTDYTPKELIYKQDPVIPGNSPAKKLLEESTRDLYEHIKDTYSGILDPITYNTFTLESIFTNTVKTARKEAKEDRTKAEDNKYPVRLVLTTALEKYMEDKVLSLLD